MATNTGDRKVNGYLPKYIGMRVLRGIVPLALKFSPSSPDPHIPPSSIEYYTCKGRKRKIHIYSPKPAIEGPLPIYISLHGAGFCLDTFGGDGYFCSRVANEVGCVVLDVDHSKGPEDPWPAAVEDIEAAIIWARERSSQNGWDGERISIGGFSSGGCHALVAASNPANKLKSVVAFYPSTNLAEDPYHKPQLKPKKGQSGGTVPPMVRRFLYSCYLHKDQDKTHPQVSPFHAEATSFPPASIITCECDSLAREARQLVDKLRRADMDVQHYEAEGQGHDWDHAIKDLNSDAGKMREKAYTLVMDRLRSQLRG